MEHAEKVEPPYCDGVHHRWSYRAPLRCLGCGHAFADTTDLEFKASYERANNVKLVGFTREGTSHGQG